jgi:hypothetical protein
MNRDYFTKPIQGGRSAHDYGNTHLTDDVRPMTPRQLVMFFAFAAIMIVIMTVGSTVVS